MASSETDMPLQYGIPQGSVLGHRIFIDYAEDVSDLFNHHAVTHYLFANDMQGQCSGPLNDASVMASRLERCCSDVSDWCACKRLQLNAARPKCCGLVPHQNSAGCDLTLCTSPSTRAPSNQRLLSATSVCCLMASSQCASKCPGCHRHAFIITPLTFRKSASRP